MLFGNLNLIILECDFFLSSEKMPNICCVPSCKKRRADKAEGEKYHKFPLNEELRKKWISAVKIHFQPTKYTVICGNHFKKTCYMDSQSGKNTVK